jgi:hypothetical protein
MVAIKASISQVVIHAEEATLEEATRQVANAAAPVVNSEANAAVITPLAVTDLHSFLTVLKEAVIHVPQVVKSAVHAQSAIHVPQVDSEVPAAVAAIHALQADSEALAAVAIHAIHAPQVVNSAAHVTVAIHAIHAPQAVTLAGHAAAATHALQASLVKIAAANPAVR